MSPTKVPHIITGDDDQLLPVLRRAISGYIQIDFAVAFVQCSGFFKLHDAIEEALEQGAQIRMLVGDYLGITSPDAMDVMLALKDRFGNINIKVFETEGHISFHPKAYLFKCGRDATDTGEIIIGSSNISHSALTEGIEWNLRIQQQEDPERFALILQRFETLFQDPRTVILDRSWVNTYRSRRTVRSFATVEIEDQGFAPFSIQTEALKALAATRTNGCAKGLVVMATGMGKTWLAGFDVRAMAAHKVLFIAHREEILRQAMTTFQRIMPHKQAGIFMANEKATDKDFIFATVQSLGRRANLHTFDSKHFDYIIIDEFHHAAANMYRRIMEYFEPKFLLGLTATPERTDTLNVSTLCDGNTVFEYHLHQGISEKHLSPFVYYGICDTGVDYKSIPWRNGQFEEGALEELVITQERAGHILKEWKIKGGEKTIAFCVSRRHSDFMAEYFNKEGFAAASVHSSSKTRRTVAVEDLKSGQIKVLFSVDIFNEGFDLPHIDTVMMLRPTESKILFLQQLGRGLRKHATKQHLKVLDFIGNHQSFLKRPNWILGENFGAEELKFALIDIQANHKARVPEGCEINFDIEVINFFEELLRSQSGREVVLYEQLKIELDRRPTASEFWQQGGALTKIRSNYRSWFAFVDKMGDLEEDERAVFETSKSFLKDLEIPKMTKCFKMVLLTSILDADGLYTESNIEAITKRSWEQFEAHPDWKVDLPDNLKNGSATKHSRNFLTYWNMNPIEACVNSGFFRKVNKSILFSHPLPEDRTDILDSMARELIDLRMKEYFSRSTEIPQTNENGKIFCRVIHSGGRPIIKLSDKLRSHLPTKTSPVQIEGKEHCAYFVKFFLNKVTLPNRDNNILPEILRQWFGPEAGHNGSTDHVTFEQKGDTLVLGPVPKIDKNTATITREFLIKSELGPEDQKEEWLPLLPLEAAAGRLQEKEFGLEAESYIHIKNQTLPSNKNALFVTRIKGDSMEPVVHDGEYALFSKAIAGSKNLEIILVEHHGSGLQDFAGELLIKRYRSEKSEDEEGMKHTKIILESLNPAYPPIIFEGEELTGIRILARYVGKLS